MSQLAEKIDYRKYLDPRTLAKILRREMKGEENL